MISKLAGFILNIWGFKITGNYPYHAKKKVFIVIPHTSNWDFPLGILVRTKLKATINFLAKDSLFKPPFGFIFKWLGGVPVDRSKSNNFVDSTVQLFKEREALTIQIAPEGTRKKVDKLKTGFYYICLKAEVPLFFVKFDWGTKVVHFSDEITLSGNKEKDLKMIDDYFRTTKGKIPEYSYLYKEGV